MTCTLLTLALYSRVEQTTVIYYFGLTFLKVVLSCHVAYICGRRALAPKNAPLSEEDLQKWNSFLDSVETDRQYIAHMCSDVKKTEFQENEGKFTFVFGDDLRRTFIHTKEKTDTISLSSLSNSSLFEAFVYKHEELLDLPGGNPGDNADTQSDMLTPFSFFNPELPITHPILKSPVGQKHYRATELKEDSWRHRLEFIPWGMT